MKKTITLLLAIVLSTSLFVECKQKEAKKETKKEQVTETNYSIEKAKKKITFIAYKTTEKIDVNGAFKKIKITKSKEAKTISEAINEAEFEIPVNSIETGDKVRDAIIENTFFKVMTNSQVLKGTFYITDDKTGYINLVMNGVTEKLPFEYTIKDKEFAINAKMDINKWSANEALTSLNKACLDLHKGEDGVSKTWEEVAVKATCKF